MVNLWMDPNESGQVGAGKEVLSGEESPENVLIKCSTKGNNWATILKLSCVLGQSAGGLHRIPGLVHARWRWSRPAWDREAGSREEHRVRRHWFLSPVLKISFKTLFLMSQKRNLPKVPREKVGFLWKQTNTIIMIHQYENHDFDLRQIQSYNVCQFITVYSSHQSARSFPKSTPSCKEPWEQDLWTPLPLTRLDKYLDL